MIYGVKSSGNESERGYSDDCLSGDESINKALEIADQLELVLNRGGFLLKGVTFRGKDPPAAFSADNSSINGAGMKWFSKEDLLSLDISELNFAKKNRGKK